MTTLVVFGLPELIAWGSCSSWVPVKCGAANRPPEQALRRRNEDFMTIVDVIFWTAFAAVVIIGLAATVFRDRIEGFLRAMERSK